MTESRIDRMGFRFRFYVQLCTVHFVRLKMYEINVRFVRLKMYENPKCDLCIDQKYFFCQQALSFTQAPNVQL